MCSFSSHHIMPIGRKYLMDIAAHSSVSRKNGTSLASVIFFVHYLAITQISRSPIFAYLIIQPQIMTGFIHIL